MATKEFQKISLSEVLKKVRNPVILNPKEKYREIGIRSHGKGIFYKGETTAKEIGNKSVFWVEPDCLIVNIVFAWEQAIARTTKKDKGFIASHRFPMFKANTKLADLDYILYFFSTKYGKHLLTLASPGGAGRNKTLGQSEFLDLKIPLPSLNEQKKITEILLCWDHLINTCLDLELAYQSQFNGIMKNIFEKKSTAQFKLDELSDVIMGSSPSSTAYNSMASGLPLIQGNADIKNRRSAPRQHTSEITKETYPGDILVAVRAPVGEVAISKHHACIGRGVAAVRAYDQTYQTILYYALMNAESKWARISQGSTFEAINSSDLRSYVVSLPSRSQQIASYSELLKKLDNRVRYINKLRKSFMLQKRGLMQQLLTGKKRVRC